MSLLASLEIGTFGLSLEPGEEVTLTHADDEVVELEDPNKGVAFWLYFFPNLHMVLSAARLDTFRQSAERYARQMFIKTGEADDFDGPLRTEDANWSPLVDFELTEVCHVQALQTVHRMVYRAGREVMMGHLLIPLDTGLFEVRVMAQDDTTGFREVVVAMMQDSSIEARQNTDPKTYDAVELDEKFPEHCLSRARWGLRAASSWISEVRLPAPTLVKDKVTLPKLNGAFTPPLGFVHCDSENGIEYFNRVSFCGTDGVEVMLVQSESRRPVAASELLALAESISRKHHEDSDCRDIQLTASEVACDTGHAVSVVVDYAAEQGTSRNLLYWFLDARGRARSLTFLDVKHHLESAMDEAKAAANSWEIVRGWMHSLRKQH